MEGKELPIESIEFIALVRRKIMMTNQERYDRYKFLLRYGTILADTEIDDLRVRRILYNKKEYIHIMKNGECVSVRRKII